MHDVSQTIAIEERFIGVERRLENSLREQQAKMATELKLEILAELTERLKPLDQLVEESKPKLRRFGPLQDVLVNVIIPIALWALVAVLLYNQWQKIMGGT